MTLTLTLHPYICGGCPNEVLLTELQYLKAIDDRGNLFCESCLEKRMLAKERAKRLPDVAEPERAEPSRKVTNRQGGGNPDGLRTTSGPPRRERV